MGFRVRLHMKGVIVKHHDVDDGVWEVSHMALYMHFVWSTIVMAICLSRSNANVLIINRALAV
jgi:hypothetical protein